MFYINPRTMDKEQWLSTHARQVDRGMVEFFTAWNGTELPCLWVMDEDYTAADVAVDEAELNALFSNKEDKRIKAFFLVPKEALFALHPELKEALDGKE